MHGLFTVHLSFVEIHPWKSLDEWTPVSVEFSGEIQKQPLQLQLLREISWLRAFIIIIIYFLKIINPLFNQKNIIENKS